jgi:iron complex transport system permease protein
MKRSVLYFAGLILLVIFFILSLKIGVIHVQTPLLKLIGQHSGTDATTVWDIRFPRAMGALIVGAALGVAGALAQGIFRNPLAEPSLIGLSSGATLGTIAIISSGAATFGSGSAVESAILFAALSAFLIYFVAPSKGFGFLITGIALSAILVALAGILISISTKPDIQAISFWNFGSLSLLNNSTVKVIAPFIETGFILALFVSRKLDLYSLGESSARYLGINPRRVRVLAIIALAFLIGPAVSTVGSIAFLGLLVPHIVRLLVGPSHRRMVGLSAIIGADLLLLADLLARTVFKPHEIPLGLVTSLIGAPVLIALLRTKSAIWVSHD